MPAKQVSDGCSDFIPFFFGYFHFENVWGIFMCYLILF